MAKQRVYQNFLVYGWDHHISNENSETTPNYLPVLLVVPSGKRQTWV